MLRSRIPQITIEIEHLVDEAIEEGAERVALSAKERVRVRSGDLQRAIHIDPQKDGKYVVAGDDDDVFYGHMVEFGTSHSPPFPFLVPSLEENRNEIVATVQGSLRRL